MKQRTPNTGNANDGRRLGATTVEMAFALPILLTVLFAAIDCARLNMLRNSAENAVYEGCRSAIVPGATIGQVTAVTQKVLRAVGAVNSTVTVSPTPFDPNSRTVTVKVVIPLKDNSWVPAAMGSQRNMVKTCTMSRERTRRGF
jgi:Flp pilus assembly protein TadG